MKSRDLKESEVEAILNRFDTLRDKCLFILGLKTGFRISELLSLTLNDVWDDVKCHDVVTVRRCNMKGKASSRSVPLHPVAKEALRQYIDSIQLRGNYKLFQITRVHAWRLLKQASIEANLNNVSTHSMRKTFGMNVYNRTDKNIVAAQRALGHKSLASTSHYLSVDQELVDKAILA